MLSDPFCIRLIVLAPLEIIWWKSNGMDQRFSNCGRGISKFSRNHDGGGGGEGSRHQKLSRGLSTSQFSELFSQLKMVKCAPHYN